MLGAAFITIQGFEWAGKPFIFSTNAYSSAFFVLTGVHMAHVAVGLLMLVMLLVWTLLGRFDTTHHEHIALGALYWHFVDAVWIVVFHYRLHRAAILMTALHPLARAVGHPSTLRHAAPKWLVLVALFLAPSAWSLQLLASYLLNGDTCTGGVASLLPPGPRLVVLAVIGALATAACVIGLAAARRTWRLTRDEARGDHHAALTSGAGRTRFLGLCGIIASSIFLVGAIFALLIPLLVPPCAASLF